MKRTVARLDASVVAQQFPLQGLLPGWFFRVREVSPGAYVAEGSDLWGRAVSHQGDDPEALVQRCVASARELAV
jgi:hypothetical protein